MIDTIPSGSYESPLFSKCRIVQLIVFSGLLVYFGRLSLSFVRKEKVYILSAFLYSERERERVIEVPALRSGILEFF